MKNTQLNSLLSQKNHLLDSIDKRRQTLSELWKRGITDSDLTKHHVNYIELHEKKIDDINDKIFDLC